MTSKGLVGGGFWFILAHTACQAQVSLAAQYTPWASGLVGRLLVGLDTARLVPVHVMVLSSNQVVANNSLQYLLFLFCDEKIIMRLLNILISLIITDCVVLHHVLLGWG